MKKKKKNGKSNGNRNGNKNNLEWHILNFVQPCEACHQINVVHAIRQSGKLKKAVRGHCENIECSERMEVITYVEAFGADINAMTCEVCNKEITVLGYREKNHGHKEAVYGICINSECRERGRKFCYVGARIQISVVEEESISKSSYPPLFVVPKQRWGEKRVPYKNDVAKMQRQILLRARA